MSQLVESLAGQYDRLPPHSIEAEKCYLGSVMITEDPLERSRLSRMVRPDEFYLADHQIIFESMRRVIESANALDFVLLKDDLQKRQVYEEVGGREYLAELLGCVPSYAHCEHYAGIIRDHAVLRAIISASNDVLRKAYSPLAGSPAELANECAMMMAKAADGASGLIIHKLGNVWAEIANRGPDAAAERIPTGLYTLDQLIGGVRRQGKTIIGAKPGVGKSALLKQLALNFARNGVGVGIISVEESRFKIGENTLANLAQVANNRIAFNNLSNAEGERLLSACTEFSGLPVYIVDTARKLSEISAAAHQLVAKHQVQVIIVDHLHIVDGETDEHREREISKISAALKWLWKTLNVAGIEAAQLNRKDGRDRPTLASLRDSGSLEQDGDTVILLHAEDYYRRGEFGYQPDYVLEALVLKNKDGAAGVVPLTFNMAMQQIMDKDEIQV